jgi:arylsulfatase A-like enzyme
MTGTPTEWDNLTLSEFYGGLVSIEASAIANRMVRDERYKYIYYQGFPSELFDMIDDPDETTNLINDPALEKTKTRLHAIALTNWDAAEIIQKIDRKAQDVTILKNWTQATNPAEEYRWQMKEAT